MERERFDKMLDEWLDRASAEFGKAAIRPGFEARIAAEFYKKTARRSFWFRCQALAAATAVLVILFWAFSSRFADRSEKQVASNSVEVPRPGSQQEEVGTSKSRRAVMQPPIARKSGVVVAQQTRESLPRQDVFPSARLSKQERLLLSYTRSIASGEIAGFVDDPEYRPIEITNVEIPKTEISKLEIDPISIEPLP